MILYPSLGFLSGEPQPIIYPYPGNQNTDQQQQQQHQQQVNEQGQGLWTANPFFYG